MYSTRRSQVLYLAKEEHLLPEERVEIGGVGESARARVVERQIVRHLTHLIYLTPAAFLSHSLSLSLYLALALALLLFRLRSPPRSSFALSPFIAVRFRVRENVFVSLCGDVAAFDYVYIHTRRCLVFYFNTLSENVNNGLAIHER